MRIDYSEPKKSCSSPQGSVNRPRKESSGGLLFIAFIATGILCLGIGFGSGWTLSQRAAKQGFKAAMEQQSLENSPQQVKVQPQPQPSAVPAPQPVATQQPQITAAPSGGTQTPSDPPLSFYKTLPSGQKNNAMGSGINARDDKPAKQPLQAVMPANMVRPTQPQNEDNALKPPAQASASRAGIRQDTRQDTNSLTVQVASYSLKSEAEALRAKLAAKGYNVNIVESRLGDKGIWYRVRVGKRLDPDAAKELAEKIGKGAIAIPDRD